ncbi:MAG: ribosome silencing factor [Rubrivivax sp.]|nr:ribosome silencing factor [Rubrivivax sp.]
MDIRKLQRAIVDGLEDVKAQNVVVFNTEALSPLFERVIIASGTSNRQTKALASSVRETVKKRGLAVLRTEGEDNGEWIIVDCGAAVAHIMQPAIRDYYHLEEIWGAKPVRLKGSGDASVVRLLPKASEPPAAPSPAASRAQARQTSTRAAAGSASRKTPAKAAPKGLAAKKGGAKTAEAKKAAARRPAPRKSPTGRPGAKASPAAKPAARKAPAKRPGLGARPAPRKAGAAKPRPR